MTATSVAYAWHDERPRTLKQVRAHLEVRLSRLRAELTAQRFYGEPTICPANRSIHREIAALRRRLNMIDAEIAAREGG